MSLLRTVSLLWLIGAAIAGASAQTRPFPLTVDSIMRGHDLVGYAPREVYWSPDGKQVYFRWKRAGENGRKPFDRYVVNADGSGLRRLTDEEAKNAPPEGGESASDKRHIVLSENGDLFLYERETGRKRQLTATDETESDPRFAPDGNTILFVRNNNVFSLSLTESAWRQLTDIRSGSPPPTPAEPKNTSQEASKRAERDLFETIRQQAQEREEREAKRKKEEKRRPFYVPTGQSVVGLNASPNGAYVAVLIREGEAGGRNTIVPRYITESGYTQDETSYARVGDLQGRLRVVVLKSESGEAFPLEFTAPPITTAGVPDGPRRLSWSGFRWSPDGKTGMVRVRAEDNKDDWLLRVDPETGETGLLAHRHDDAWIGGPEVGTYGFLPDGKRAFYVSEEDGYAGLYVVPIAGGTASRLTPPRREVQGIRLSPDRTRFYFTSNEGNPADRFLYSVPVDGGAPTRIVRLSGAEEDTAIPSPDDRFLAVVRSESHRPPELFLLPNRPDPSAIGIRVTQSPTTEWLSHPWSRPPIVTFRARDGRMVPARLYRPPNWRPGGPAVLFAHGAGYLQNVHHWWSGYFREYMFHHLLMARGFLVLDVDYCGSAGYGRDWRTGIYRHMGGKDLNDLVDGARWIVAKYGVAPRQIGVYGGSYGGFLTLMAMFTTPEVFAAGAALRPVTDWAHYNHPYTANILNQPQHDPEAYRRSSPIFFAGGLRGALLICHGMNDSNVHFQDSVRLVQRLIELRKENWELAVYPVEDHRFTEPTGWADEYRRILKLFETTLKK
ncbi:MAG: prolyl oligopeptidase family serine peptidase [Capsulimonadales bacterium]|nr:prolyl oligopeptidase family serine peptidase [Capsulimonadales bacterium]